MTRRAPSLAVAAIFAAALSASLAAQAAQIRVKPGKVTLKIGQSVKLEAQVLDVGGRPVDAPVFFFSRSRGAVSVDRSGKVTALKSGDYSVTVRVASRQRPRISAVVPVKVLYPKPKGVEFRGPPTRVYAHTTVPISAVVLDVKGRVRPDLRPRITSADPKLASIDPFGNLTATGVGSCEITAAAGDISTKTKIEIVANPVRSLELFAKQATVRTGDVVHFLARAKDANGQETKGVPVHLSFVAKQKDTRGPGASGQIEQDGRFVAETPGMYTVVATCGNVVARRVLEVIPRNVRKRLVKVGHGPVLDVHTSDLWVWEGVDGRDYAVTGTWGANGDAIFWDVTDPADMKEISRVKVDARTVNDVKVSKDGRTCIISREGASNRKNGIILLDVTNPRSPKKLSTFTKNLTGGVHNVFIDKNFVYALSAGRRYDIIEIK